MVTEDNGRDPERLRIDNNGYVGVGTNAPNTKLDVNGNAFVRGSGTIANNGGAAELQIGYGLAAAGTAGSVSRLAIQPYGHTGGPWKFIARDDSNKAYLDWVYGINASGITQDSQGNVGVGVMTPGYLLDVGQRMRLRSGGDNFSSAGIYFNDNANSEAAFFGMEDDTHIGFFGNGASWNFTMNTTTGALKVGGSEGQAGQVITSNGAAAAQWKSSTNLLYQGTNINVDTGQIIPPDLTPMLIPGLSQTVNVSGNAKLLVQFNVAMRTFPCIGCLSAEANIQVTLDGGVINKLRQNLPNGNEYAHISGSWLQLVGAGNHTVEIKAFSAGPIVAIRQH